MPKPAQEVHVLRQTVSDLQLNLVQVTSLLHSKVQTLKELQKINAEIVCQLNLVRGRLKEERKELEDLRALSSSYFLVLQENHRLTQLLAQRSRNKVDNEHLKSLVARLHQQKREHEQAAKLYCQRESEANARLKSCQEQSQLERSRLEQANSQLQQKVAVLSERALQLYNLSQEEAQQNKEKRQVDLQVTRQEKQQLIFELLGLNEQQRQAISRLKQELQLQRMVVMRLRQLLASWTPGRKGRHAQQSKLGREQLLQRIEYLHMQLSFKSYTIEAISRCEMMSS